MKEIISILLLMVCSLASLGAKEPSSSIITEGELEVFSHEVKKGENVYSISKQYGVPLEVIYRNNPEAKKGVKPGDIIILSSKEASKVYKPVNTNQPIEYYPNASKSIDEENPEENSNSTEGIEEISEESEPLMNQEDHTIKIALILDDPTSNKDIDFTRGSLLAVNKLKNTEKPISLKIFDGRNSTSDIVNELDQFIPTVIISTSDKAFPLFLADYGNTANIKVVNVFDLRNDLYEDNPSIIQILPPSVFFNEKIANELYLNNRGRKLISVGDTDENDGIGKRIEELYGEDTIRLSLEEFGNFEPDLLDSYLIYSYASKKEEVADFLTNVETIDSNNPGIRFKIGGRLSWISMIDDFGDKFKEFSAVIPARVWLDENSKAWNNFTEEYENSFVGYPVRSIPNYAAEGYDVTQYFITHPSGASSSIFTNFYDNDSYLQSSFSFVKNNDSEGMVNGVGYLIEFGPDGRIEKVTVQ